MIGNNSGAPYHFFAPYYEAWHDPTWYAEILPFLQEHGRLKAGDRIYEGGCGAGHLTRALADAGCSVVATDRSVAMLRFAKRRLGNRDVVLFREDLRQLPRRQGFDAFIFFLDVVHYLWPQDLAALFHTVYHSLTPGGMLVFDHLPELLLRRRAAKAPLCITGDKQSLWWKTTVQGQTALYDLRMRTEDAYHRETQLLYMYKKRQIRRLLKATGKWQIDGYGDYADRPMKARAERFCWFAKKSR